MNLQNKIIEDGSKFFELFKRQFRLLKEYRDFNAEEYKVSQKETLIAQVSNNNPPKELDLRTYNLILFPSNDFQIEFRIIESGEFALNLFNVNRIKRSVRSYTRHFFSLVEAFSELELELLKNLYKNQKCLLSLI